MSANDIVHKLERKALIVNLVGRLSVLSEDESKEFDSLLERISQRLDHYEKYIGS